MHGTTATTRPRSNHEIFITKINNFTNFECFTKYLCLENLELYGILFVTVSIMGNTVLLYSSHKVIVIFSYLIITGIN